MQIWEGFFAKKSKVESRKSSEGLRVTGDGLRVMSAEVQK